MWQSIELRIEDIHEHCEPVYERKYSIFYVIDIKLIEHFLRY